MTQIHEGEVVPPLAVNVMPRFDLSRDRHVLEMRAGATIAEIVDRAMPDLPAAQRGFVRVTINGEVVPQPLWAHVRPKPNAVVVVRAVPGQGNTLRMVLMVVVLIAAIALGQYWIGPALAGTMGITASGWAAVGTAVVMAAGSLLVNALVPMETNKGGADKQRYSISGAQNSLAPNAPVPLVLGTMRFAPPYAALPYTEDAAPVTVTLEEDPLAWLRQNAQPGDDQYFYGVYVAGVGHHQISDIRIGDTPIEQYKGVEVEVREGLPDDPPLTLITQQVVEESMTVQLSKDDGPVRRVSGGDASELSVSIRFGGLVGVTNKGKKEPVTVSIRIRCRLAGTATWTDVTTLNTTRSTSKEFRVGHRWSVPVRGRYEVEIERLTPDYDDIDQIQATCHLVALRTFRPEYPINMTQPLALIAVRILASRQLQGMIDNITALVSPVIPDWDAATQTWISRPTRNPASLARYLLQGPQLAYPRPDEQIDLEYIQYWHERNAAKGLYYDSVVTEEIKLRDQLLEVCAAGRARPIDRGDKWTVVIDEPVEIISNVISPRNAREMGWNPVYVRYPDAIRAPFFDRSNDFKRAERVVPWIGFEGTPDVVEEWQMPGITDADALWRAVRRRMHELMLRPFPYTATQDTEHLAVGPGERVLFTHDQLAEEAVAARIAAVHDAQWLDLDAPVVMSDGETYRVRIRDAEGGTRVADVVTAPGETRTIKLAGALSPAPEEGDLVIFGRYGEESVDCIVKHIEPDDQGRSARLTLLAHAPELDALTAAETPPLWDGRAGGTVVDTREPAAPRFVDIASGYEIPDETPGTVRVTLSPGAGDPVPVASYDLRHRLAGDTLWTTVTGALSIVDIAYAAGDEIELQARAKSWNNVDGAWSAVRTYEVLPQTAPGPVIGSLIVDRLVNGMRRYTWTFVEAPGVTFDDQFGVFLRARAGSWASWEDLNALHIGPIMASPWENSEPSVDGLYTFGARAVDADGNQGPPVLIEVETQPAAPVSIAATRDGDDIDIEVTMSVATDSGYVRIYRSLASAAASTETDRSGLLTAPAGTIALWTDVGAAASGEPAYRYRARAENAASVPSLPTGEALP